MRRNTWLLEKEMPENVEADYDEEKMKWLLSTSVD